MVGFNRRFAPLRRELRRQLQRAARSAQPHLHGQRGCNPRGTLDAGPRNRRWTAGRARPATSSTCCASWSAGRSAPSARRATGAPGAAERVRLDHPELCRWFDRHGALLRQRRARLSQGAARGVRRRRDLAARQFSRTDFLRARAPRVGISWRQDKGNHACVRAFVAAVREGTPSPMDFAELLEVSRASIEAARQAQAYVRVADVPAS